MFCCVALNWLRCVCVRCLCCSCVCTLCVYVRCVCACAVRQVYVVLLVWLCLLFCVVRACALVHDHKTTHIRKHTYTHTVQNDKYQHAHEHTTNNKEHTYITHTKQQVTIGWSIQTVSPTLLVALRNNKSVDDMS